MFKKLIQIGPGALVAAAFIGPGTVTTATLAGGAHGYTLLWAVLFSIIALLILQEMSARLGWVANMGLGDAIRLKIQSPALKFLASILILISIFVGNAAYQAGNLTGAVWGFEAYSQSFESLSFNPLILLVSLCAFFLLFTGKYALIEKALVLIVSSMGIIFFITAFVLQPNVYKILQGLFVPQIPPNSGLLVIGLIGTTVVPYNLFLHASAVSQKWQGKGNLAQVRLDLVLSILLGGIITMAILVCAAVVFEQSPQAISKATDLSLQLRPLLGEGATLVLAFGFLGAGLSSAITAPLAASFAVSELLGWKKDLKSNSFRGVWGVVWLTGTFFSLLGFKPTAVILLAQVANGLLLPVIASFLLWVMNDNQLMQQNKNKILHNLSGLLVILITMLIALRTIGLAVGSI